jgi:hypothetical protein
MRILTIMILLIAFVGCQKVDSLYLDVKGYPHHLPPGYSMKCSLDGKYLPVLPYGTECTPYSGADSFSTKEEAYARAWSQYNSKVSPDEPHHDWPICESNTTN